MRKRLKFFAERLKHLAASDLGKTSTRHALAAVLTVLLSEIVTQGIVGGLSCIFRHPLSTLTAFLVVYLSFSLTLPAKRRLGVYILVQCFWLGLTITNCVLLSYRVNPLSAVDFSILFSVFSIINVYLSPLQIVLIITSIAIAITAAVIMMIRLPKKTVNRKKAGIHILVTAVLTVLCYLSSALFYSDGIEELNLPDVYKEYGFIYSFSLTWTDRGIDRPEEYSRVNISNMLTDETERESDPTPDSAPVSGDTATLETSLPQDFPEKDTKPNVIIVQLESFFDPQEILSLETTADAIPNFRALREAYPSGQLTVPVSGAGTVNTEFEVLCGIPVSVFGLGEYPYETLLTTTPCESLAYYLRESGYTCHSMHNHTGTFYSRHTVMQSLGFDTFTPVEYMSGVRRNELGWAEDSILTDEIVGALASTDSVDLVYAVSVQAHGKYVSVPGDYGDIGVSGDFDDATLYGMEYYVNQLSQTDAFVGELVSALESLDEDTVVVFFGDHQPSLELTSDDVRSGSIYTTEYVIWSNFGLAADDAPLPAYGLGAHVLELLGEDGGVITRLHTAKRGDADYGKYLKEVAYDLLFGEKYAYGGAFPYEIPEIRYGWNALGADSAFVRNGSLYVTGQGFTESSTVTVDGRKRDTVFISDTLIVAVDISEAATVTVSQVADNGFVFNEIPCEVTDEPGWDFEVIGGEG